MEIKTKQVEEAIKGTMRKLEDGEIGLGYFGCVDLIKGSIHTINRVNSFVIRYSTKGSQIQLSYYCTGLETQQTMYIDANKSEVIDKIPEIIKWYKATIKLFLNDIIKI